jgi:competence protein ComEC
MSARGIRAGAGRRHDLRLVPPALAVWLTALALIGPDPWVAFAVAAICGVVGASVPATLMAATRRSGRAGNPIARGLSGPADVGLIARHGAMTGAVFACAAASAAGVGLRMVAVESGPVRELAEAAVTRSQGPREGAIATIEAVVTGEPRTHIDRARAFATIQVRAETVSRGGRTTGTRVPVLAVASDRRWRSLLISQRVRFTARMTLPRRAELLAGVAIVRGPPVVLSGPSAVQRAAEKVRTRLRQACDGLPAAQRGVLPGMVVGDTSRLDPRLAEDFRAAGLTHLMVVSGANLAILIGAVLGAGRMAGAGRRGTALFAAVSMLGFVIVARPEPSVLRAAIMGLIGLFALAGGRERRGVPVLAASVVALLLADPELARSYGFALSVSATAGLLVIAPPWRDRLRRRLPRVIAEPLAVAAAAQAACTPILVMLSGEISLVAVAANLLAEPAVAPATLLGATATAVAPFAMTPARWLVWPAGLAVGWIVGVARSAAGIPYATVSWPDGLAGAALLLVAGAVAFLVVRRRVLRRFAAAIVAGLLLVVIGVRVWAPGWPPRGWLFVACDVGQGDGLVLAAGPGRAVVVDAGPEPELMDDCLTGLGVRVVPLIVLTHPHADHIGGVPGLLRDRPSGLVMTSPLSGREESRLLSGHKVATARPGQRWTVGRLSLSVLGPSPWDSRVSTHDDGAAVNNASVVMVARWAEEVGGAGRGGRRGRPWSAGSVGRGNTVGETQSGKHSLSVLLSGDVETEAQRSLAAAVPAVQVVKVPHHGSKRQDAGFLAAARARVAIISVGAGNDYGHPAPATLTLLRALGIRVFRTDLDGTIAVTGNGDELAVVTRRSR